MTNRLDQSVDARLREMADVFEAHRGLTGKAKRDTSGAVVGRFRGSLAAYPEVAHTGYQPAQIARAVRRGKGVIYRRVRADVRRELQAYFPVERRRYPERPTIPPHERLTRKCKVCGHYHGKGQHRFHGEGSFHQTHLFTFNPGGNMPTPIYGQVLSIIAKKGRGHQCSPACKRANHTYIHRFKSRPPMTGSVDRQTLMIGKPIGGATVRNAPSRRGSVYVIRWGKPGSYSQTFRTKEAANHYLRRSGLRGTVMAVRPGFDFQSNPRGKR